MTKDLFGIGFAMFFSELCKIIMNKVTFVGFRVGDRSAINDTPRYLTWSKNCRRTTPFIETFDGADCFYFWGKNAEPSLESFQ